MKKIKVWKLAIFGSFIIFHSLDCLMDSLKCDLEDIEDIETIKISTFMMSKSEYEELDEFDGY